MEDGRRGTLGERLPTLSLAKLALFIHQVTKTHLLHLCCCVLGHVVGDDRCRSSRLAYRPSQVQCREDLLPGCRETTVTPVHLFLSSRVNKRLAVLLAQ